MIIPWCFDTNIEFIGVRAMRFSGHGLAPDFPKPTARHRQNICGAPYLGNHPDVPRSFAGGSWACRGLRRHNPAVGQKRQCVVI
jgi:hypothetical protein